MKSFKNCLLLLYDILNSAIIMLPSLLKLIKLQECKTTPGCQWWTLDKSREQAVCELNIHCPLVDSSCETCVFGQIECGEYWTACIFSHWIQ